MWRNRIVGEKLEVCLFLVFVFVATGALATDKGTGRVVAVVKVADNALAGSPVMGSLITPQGRILDQEEKFLDRAPNTMGIILGEVPAGVYDVRVEGDGFVTEVKKGIQVFAGQDRNLSFLVQPGEGVHIVEFAVAGLSREEVAARLAKLESETARLDAEVKSLKAAKPK